MDDKSTIELSNARKPLHLIKNGEDYEFDVRFSLKDWELFCKAREDGGTGRDVLVNSLCMRFVRNADEENQNEVNPSDITNEDLNKYVMCLVGDNAIMLEAYNRVDGDACQKLDAAYKASLQNAVDKLRPTINIALSNLAKAYSVTDIKPIITPGMSAAISSISKSMSNIVSSQVKLNEMLKPLMQQLSFVNNEALESIRSTVKSFGEFIKKINIPTLSDEEKNRLQEAYITWGKLGWTTIPEAPFSLFAHKPNSMKDANRLALKYCNDKNMDSIFSEILELNGFSKKDFEDAVFCFKQKRYKPCAILIFMLVDAKMIRLQKKDDKRRRPTGVTAARIIKTQVLDETSDQLYWALNSMNLFSCIEVMFENGNDFKKQPSIINRNFVGHGMLTRKVRRMDCVQLFLLFYNFINVIDLANI
ncbi:hypothetical protein [Hornefia butyriciproducens]|uniref:hypothetical protein n=1 Tax=Hornefia butyriciproducens TaxID=2652293 RepID=UPI003F8895BA